MTLLYMHHSGASVSLDLLERITLGLASVSSKASLSLADQRNLQKISCFKLYLFVLRKVLLRYFRVLHLSVLLAFVSY